MSQNAKDYSIDELICSAIARMLKDREIVFTGVSSPVQIVSIYLAKATHAPNLTHLTIMGAIDPTPKSPPVSSADPHLLEGALGGITLSDVFSLGYKGRVDVGLFGAVQIDQFGNLNNSVIGQYDKPKVRLPGGAGSGVMLKIFKRSVIFRSSHDKRAFVEKLPFVTACGWTEESGLRPGEKDAFGFVRAGGPDKIITNLAVLGFEEQSRRMKIETVHPGVEVETVVENTGFELVIPKVVPETPPPTQIEVKLLRDKIDPKDMRKLAFKEK
ncbi:MAG: CoA-transferase [Promethearchaeati archaeon SRVP18_Atabeyarchaeia-1]